jgi:N-acetylneuraminic acid mutarotase
MRYARIERLETRRLLSGTPFHGAQSPITQTIEAEDFDSGGEGVAYHDTTPQNLGGQYRNTAVDVQAGGSNGFDVGHTAAGEWLDYTISVPASGTFDLRATVASSKAGGSFHLEIDGVNLTGSIAVPDTGGWVNWQNVNSKSFALSAGTHVMRIVMDRNGYWGAVGNFDSFGFAAVTQPPPVPTPGRSPFHGVPFATTDTMQAEDFDNGGEGVAYHDTTPANLGGQYRKTGVDIVAAGSNGLCVGYTAAGEWLFYSLNVATGGTYRLQTSAVLVGSGATFHMEIDGRNLTGSIAVPNTGNWRTFQAVTSPSFALSAGSHVMKVVFDHVGSMGAVGDFDSFRLVPVTPPPPPPPPPGPIGSYTWTTGPRAPIAVAEGETAAVNGKLYIFGGYDRTSPNWLATNHAEVFDPATNSWSFIADVPSPFTHGGAAADDRYVYLAGGYISNFKTGQQTFATANVWRYDTVANTWSAMAPLPAARGAGGLVLVNDTLHFFGGVDVLRRDQSTHWTLDLATPGATWQTAAPLPSIRNHMGATVLNGKIYAIGGQVGENDSNPIATALVYDPAADRWSSIANLPAPRSHVAADTFAFDGRILVIGGESTHGFSTNGVTAYDPATNTWSQLPALPRTRHSAVARVIGNRLYVATGYDAGLRSDLWISTPIR